MNRPSIFSDGYGKASKKRNLREIIVVVILIIFTILLYLIPYLNTKITQYKTNGNSFPNLVENRKKVTSPLSTTIPSAKNTKDTKNAETKPQEENLVLDHKLDDGTIVKIKYSKVDGKVVFHNVEGDESKFYYDISPSKTKILINDKNLQTIVVYTDKLQAIDYTLEKFDYGRSGFMRRTSYIKRKNFYWCKEAKFLDDESIIYISNVAVELTSKHIRAFKVDEDNSHKLIKYSRASNIELNGATQNGYRVTIDGINCIVKPDFTLVNE